MVIEEIEKLVKDIMETDAAQFEVEWNKLEATLLSKTQWPSDALKEMMHKSFLAGCSSGSTTTIKTFMEKVFPLIAAK